MIFCTEQDGSLTYLALKCFNYTFLRLFLYIFLLFIYFLIVLSTFKC